MKYFFNSIFLVVVILFSTVSHTYAAPVKKGMAVSEVKAASQIGVDILRSGGNAIDAAVAIGYALAVTNPCCGNIGGGGFMTIHRANGENIFINFREKAPAKATPTMYVDAKGNVIDSLSTQGFLAVAVPGTVLGLETALKSYGTMSREKVMAPAIKLAEQGFKISPFLAKQIAEHAEIFRKEPNVAAIFLKKNGELLRPGDVLIQKDLANTLRSISKNGPPVFYKGDIAKAIVAASEQHHGLLSMKDFADYNVSILEPIYCFYRNYKIISSPPPSSGGTTLCEMLNILENFSLDPARFRTAKDDRLIIEAMRYGFIDRNNHLGDPDFVENPVKTLISEDYAAQIATKIRNQTEHVEEKNKLPRPELTDTTHYSVIDKDGNAVAVTYTINGFFGAGVIAGHTGFFLNNEMDDFSIKPGTENKFGLVQSDKNNIQPHKRPLSSMTPTIVMKDNQVVMVLGSPGGPRIISSVLLTLLNVIDYHMSIQDAVNAGRVHYQAIPDEVYFEPGTFSESEKSTLTSLGYHLVQQQPWSAVEAIFRDEQHNLQGANDKRRPDGAAIGY